MSRMTKKENINKIGENNRCDYYRKIAPYVGPKVPKKRIEQEYKAQESAGSRQINSHVYSSNC